MDLLRKKPMKKEQPLCLRIVSGSSLLKLNKPLARHDAGTVKTESEWLDIIGRKGSIEPNRFKSDAEWFSYYR